MLQSCFKALTRVSGFADVAGLNPTLVVDCFNMFIGCIKIVGGDVVIAPGLERLATVSAVGLLRTFAHLSAADQMSRSCTYPPTVHTDFSV